VADLEQRQAAGAKHPGEARHNAVIGGKPIGAAVERIPRVMGSDLG
jgi:hypothetical protein